jgi:hypothetical protein
MMHLFRSLICGLIDHIISYLPHRSKNIVQRTHGNFKGREQGPAQGAPGPILPDGRVDRRT